MIVANECTRNEDRRVRIAENEQLTGLDSVLVEPWDDPTVATPTVATLTITLLGHAPNEILPQQDHPLEARNIRITGSPRSLPFGVNSASVVRTQEARDDRLSIRIEAAKPHDLSARGYGGTYTLEIIELDNSGQPTGRSHPAFDQFFSSIEFHLVQGNETENDCRRPARLPAPRRASPEINYLAKDYESFRQLILDRLSTVLPRWRDRSPADVGITLVEILAHVGDQLSYYQDAVATEAYLNTARQRISVRRHVRLVDYFMHEGCNARSLVVIKPMEDLDPVPAQQLGFATKPDVGRTVETRVIAGPGGTNVGEIFAPLLEPETPLRITINDLKDPASLAGGLEGELLAKFKAELSKAFEEGQLPVRVQLSAEQEPTEVPEYAFAQLPVALKVSLIEKDPKQLPRDELQDLWLLLLRRAIILLVAQVDSSNDQEVSLLRKLFHEFVNTALRNRLGAETLKLLEQYSQVGPPSSALELALAEELNAHLQSPIIRDIIFRPAVAGLNLPSWFRALQSLSKEFPAFQSLSEEFADASVEAKQKAAKALSQLGVHLPSLIFKNTDSQRITVAEDQLDDQAIVEWNYRLLEDAFPWQLARRRQLTPGLRFYAAHNCMHFHTWGSRTFVLHAGSTSAALVDQTASCPKAHQNPAGNVAPGADLLPDRLQPPGPLANLQPGDVLIFEEVNSTATGNPSDADISKRHAVRLTRVRFEHDRAFDLPIVRLWWRGEDALPFDLCVATVGPASRNCELLCDVSVARGNVVLVDHGQRVPRRTRNGVTPIALQQNGSERLFEDLGSVPKTETGPACEAESTPGEVAVLPGRFNPRLNERPLIFSEPLAVNLPATRFFAQYPRGALPDIELWSFPPAPGDNGPLFSPSQLENPVTIAQKLLDDELDILDRALLGRLPVIAAYIQGDKKCEQELTLLLKTELPKLLRRWQPRRDLLASQDNDRHFVVEIDNDGFAHLRFGDGDLGRRPAAGEHFIANYRIGDPADGNVGTNTITEWYPRPVEWNGIDITLTNPLPALGGTAPESMDEVRQLAPHAIRSQLQRAIVADDYAQLVNEHFADRIQRAIAERRWTGSWEEILVTVDPLNRVEPDADLLEEIDRFLYRFRRIGHDVMVAGPEYVPLRIWINVFVKRGFQRDHVRQDLLQALGDEVLPDGQLGFFHPDRLSFGQGVFLSRLIEAAGQVTGVEHVEVTKFERFFDGSDDELAEGIIRLGTREIARMDGDRDYPERGVLKLTLCEASE